MSHDSKPSPVAVRACIDQWKEGSYGRYALAKVVSPDPPSAVAQFSLAKLKVEPPLGEAFECFIDFVDHRWRVVRLGEAMAPVEQELSGCVEALLEHGGKRTWRIVLSEGQAASGHANLKFSVLKAARFAHLSLGHAVTFMALPAGVDTWEVTRLLSPTLAQAIADPQQACILVALRDWHSGDTAQSVPFAALATAGGAWPQVNVFCEGLRRQQIARITAVALDAQPNVPRMQEALASAEQTLRQGTIGEVAALSVSYLSGVLAWDARGYWNLQRLKAPLALREPVENEVIEWIEGTVVSVEPVSSTATARAEEPATPGERDDLDTEADAAVQPAAPVLVEKMNVTLSIVDARLGRGLVSGYLKAAEVEYGRLEKGTIATVRLKGKPPRWYVNRLHRSLPQRGDA